VMLDWSWGRASIRGSGRGMRRRRCGWWVWGGTFILPDSVSGAIGGRGGRLAYLSGV
jgi:hypothetical protein